MEERIEIYCRIFGSQGEEIKKKIVGFMSEPISIQEKWSGSRITSGKERWLCYA